MPGVFRAEWRGQYGGYDDRIQPYVNQPEGMQDGVPQYYATTCRMCGAGCGIYIRTMNGRAIKVEGNPSHPVSGGKTCSRGQAALQHLYNPDRLRRPKWRIARTQPLAEERDWNAVLTRVAQGLQSAQGRRLILADAMELQTSPSMTASITGFARAVGAEVVAYTLLDDAPWRAAASAVYGHNQLPYYALDQADCILAFSSNFLEAWPSPVLYNRLFGDFRQGARRRQGEHGRFYYIGPRMSMTAAKADRWIPCDAGQEGAVAAAVMSAIGNPAGAQAAGGVPADVIGQVATAFANAGTRAVALGGDGLIGYPDATAAFTAVERLNQHVRSQCVGFGTPGLPSTPPTQSGFASLQPAIQAMAGGTIGALAYIGQSNPIFTLPSALGLATALPKVPFIVALTPFEDETTGFADIVLPTRSFLEHWSDSVPHVIPTGSRVASLLQPIVDPAYIFGNGIETNFIVKEPWMDTRPLTDLLSDIAHRANGATLPSGEDGVRRAWAGVAHTNAAAPASADTAWNNTLATGGIWSTGAASTAGGGGGAPAGTAEAGATAPAPPPAPEPGTLALSLYPHIFWTDGRHSNLPWLQEIPDPMTSAVWNSWVEINVDTAHRHGIKTGDIVRLTSAHGSIEVPAIPYPAIHPDVVAMPIGQGHGGEHYGRTANGRGANPLSILDPTSEASTGALAFQATRVRIAKVRDARPMDLVLLQDIPGGAEPDAVKNLIHETAREWSSEKPQPSNPERRKPFI
jgi:anaerobic selenocysteine-containing dehydrogenase